MSGERYEFPNNEGLIRELSITTSWLAIHEDRMVYSRLSPLEKDKVNTVYAWVKEHLKE